MAAKQLNQLLKGRVALITGDGKHVKAVPMSASRSLRVTGTQPTCRLPPLPFAAFRLHLRPLAIRLPEAQAAALALEWASCASWQRAVPLP